MKEMPQAFLARMQSVMTAEAFSDFSRCIVEKASAGLRVNSWKISAAALFEMMQQSMPEECLIAPDQIGLHAQNQDQQSVLSGPISWCKDGYWIHERLSSDEVRFGKRPEHAAGLYYLQEPSAMAPVELLDVQKGMRVLDLCAAPGGKTTQIASKLAGTGLLVCNDPHPQRVKALARNVERCAPGEVMVCNEQPERLATVFAGFFDRILVDAPCSGEGMFRKDESLRARWREDQAEADASVQRAVLDAALSMLKPGGRLVYSTCTFHPAENEAVILQALRHHPGLQVVPVQMADGWGTGCPEWLSHSSSVEQPLRIEPTSIEFSQLQNCIRLWPHRIRGEGHFAAVLVKASADDSCAAEPVMNRSHAKENRKKSAASGSAEAASAWHVWMQEHLSEHGLRRWQDRTPAPRLILSGNYLTLLPAESLPDLGSCQIYRYGLYLGELSGQKGPKRFLPSAGLALQLFAEDVQRSLHWRPDDQRVIRYLRGETVTVDPQEIRTVPGAKRKGYVLVCISGMPLGWARTNDDGLLKNDYPVGWRWEG